MRKIHLIIIAIVILTFIIEPGMGVMVLLIGGVILSFDMKRRRIHGANPRPFNKGIEGKSDETLKDEKTLEDDKTFV